jgi:hypothetical protein
VKAPVAKAIRAFTVDHRRGVHLVAAIVRGDPSDSVE